MTQPEPTPDRFSPGYYARRPELVASMILLLGFLVLTSMQVVSRFVMDLPFVWTEELTASLVIWMTFLGAAAVQRRDQQVRVELIETMIGPRATAWLYGIYDLFILASLACLVYGGWATLGELEHQRTPALQIPFRYLFLVVPFASAFMTFFVVRNAIRRFRTPPSESP